MLNLISYTENYYLESAVRRLSILDNATSIELRKDLALPQNSLEHIVLINDKAPSDSLLHLAEYRGFKAGDRILVISDIVSAQVAARFITKTCHLVVQNNKSMPSKWLSTCENQTVVTSGSYPTTLLTAREKRFLHVFGTTQFTHEQSKSLGVSEKSISARKRSIMRKLGVNHTIQLLNYMNTTNLSKVLIYL